MKCYYHPEVDAVGLCSQCGKAGCRGCIQDVGGALLCTSCMAQARQDVAAEHAAMVAKAKSTIMWSWIFTAVVSLFAIIGILGSVSQSGAGVLLLIPLAVYGSWSLFWGWGPIWRGWKGFFANLGCSFTAAPLIFLIVVVLFFYIPFWVAIIYGALGGAFVQYRKTQRLAQSQIAAI